MRTLLLLSICCLGPLLCGCGSDDTPSLGQVRGTVTLDGQPVEGAFVYFKAVGAAGGSGRTDASGQYTLRFIGKHDGAVLGENEVTVTLPDKSASLTEETEQTPAKLITTFQKTVEPGENEFNFELKSG